MAKIQHKVQEYDDIFRGSSITIPIQMKRLDDTPFDLTDYKVFFTMKSAEYDYDYTDIRSLINKEVVVPAPLTGKFFIQLSSKETWQPPGLYYFDIELVKDDAVYRIGLFSTNIIGGPTNRNINTSDNPISFSNMIAFTLGGVEPIVLITPLISDPPDNLIETIQAYPAYLLKDLDSPVRNVRIYSYAPKVSFSMFFFDEHDGLNHSYFCENYSPILPDDCFFHNATIDINNRTLLFNLLDEYDIEIYEQHICPPIIKPDGFYLKQKTTDPIIVADYVISGSLNIIISASKMRYAHIVGNYVMPHALYDQSHWLFNINYFNWE